MCIRDRHPTTAGYWWRGCLLCIQAYMELLQLPDIMAHATPWDVLMHQPGSNSGKRMSFSTILYYELWLYPQYSGVRASSVVTGCAECNDIARESEVGEALWDTSYTVHPLFRLAVQQAPGAVFKTFGLPSVLWSEVLVQNYYRWNLTNSSLHHNNYFYCMFSILIMVCCILITISSVS